MLKGSQAEYAFSGGKATDQCAHSSGRYHGKAAPYFSTGSGCSTAVRTDVVPVMLDESAAVRAEVAQVRAVLQPTLTRMEAMVDKADKLASRAGEDAMKK